MITGIKYIAPRGTSGYSEAAKDYMIALYEAGYPISWQQMVFDETDYQTGERNQIANSLINKDIEYNKVILHLTPEHWPALIKKYKKEGVEIIGMTVWETDRLDDRWVDWINMVDRVIVPCYWNKQVLETCGVKIPIGVIPHISRPLPEIKCEIPGIDKDDYIFYSIGQWTTRKGIDDTIKAYLNAFTKEDKTCLVIKTFKSNYSEEERQLIRNWVHNIMKFYINPAKVILLLDELSDDQIAALHYKGDCYVSLCKSEGWGLGAFDAASIGNPVVMTDFGGQIDFLDRYLVSYKLVPVEGMSWIPWYNNSQRWAQPDVEIASIKLQQVFNQDKEDIKRWAKQDMQIIKENFNSKTITNNLIKFLNG